MRRQHNCLQLNCNKKLLKRKIVIDGEGDEKKNNLYVRLKI